MEPYTYSARHYAQLTQLKVQPRDAEDNEETAGPNLLPPDAFCVFCLIQPRKE